MTPAESLVERTGRAVAYVMEQHCATDMASFIDELPMPDDEHAKASKIQDATETFLRSLSYTAAYTYGLCLMTKRELADAGKLFRSSEVQFELRQRAMRVAMAVMG